MTLPPITNCPLPLVQDVMSTSCSQDQMKKKNKIKQLNSNYMNSQHHESRYFDRQTFTEML